MSASLLKKILGCLEKQKTDIIGVNTACFSEILTTEKKVGCGADDWDSGDLNVGQKATNIATVTVDGGSQSVTIEPVDGFTFNDLGQTGDTREIEICWTYDGTTPNQPLTAQVVATDGTTATITSSDFAVVSGGSESKTVEFTGDVKQYLKEICFDGAPSVYQNDAGEVVDVSELTRCEPDPPEPPQEPPKQYVYAGTLYQFEEQEQAVQVEYWQPEVLGGSAVAHDNVTNIFGSSLNAHPNPPDKIFTLTNLNVSTATAAFLAAAEYESNASTNGTDQLRITFYTCGDGATLVDSNRNTGERGAIVVNGALVAEDTSSSVGADPSAIPPTDLCSGINKVVVATSDQSAWQGYQPDADGLSVYAAPPVFNPIKVFKCSDLSGGFVDCDGSPVEVGEKDLWHPPGDNCGSGVSSGSVLPETLRIEDL